MTSPAFNSFIAINTPSLHERITEMTPATFGVDDHINELRQLATDLRMERALAARRSTGPNRVRVAIGNALVNLGTAVAASPRQRVPAR
jgi:hypothetical protein